MEQVCIPIPMPKGEAIELSVTVGGTRHLMQYRVESVAWPPDSSPDTRFERLRAFIQNYEPGWELVQIGAPGADTVPVTFRMRRTSSISSDTSA